MYKAILTAAIVVLPLFAVTPAFAMKGIDAARACNANPKCKLLLDDAGGATIIIDGTVIDCNSPQEDCIVVARVHGRGEFGPSDSVSTGGASVAGADDDGDTGGTGGGHGGFAGGGNVGTFASTATANTGGGIIQ